MTKPEVKTRISQFNAPFLGNVLDKRIEELNKQKQEEITKLESLNKDLITKGKAADVDQLTVEIENKYNHLMTDMVAQVQFNAFVNLTDNITDMHMSIVSLMNKLNDNIKALHKSLKITNQLLVKKK